MTGSLKELDLQHILHPYTSIDQHLSSGPHIMAEGKGIHVTDSNGKEYIDAMAGLWCVNVGYGHPEMVEAIREQVARLSYYHQFMSFSNENAIHLARRVTTHVGGSLNKVFYCNSGSEANDTQVKLVWYYNNLRGRPEKKKIISRHGAYHGVTVAAGSMSGLPPMHKAFDLPVERFLHVGRPSHYWEAPTGMSEHGFSELLAEELERRINEEGPETIAAFIAEPVMGAGGVIVPPAGYFDAIVPILREHDILLIADEVICGFGRLGAMFGAHKFEFQPDMMTIAKGLTSGYVPMAACVISDEIWDVLREGSHELGVFAHGYTYSGHPVAAAAGMKSLDIIERDKLAENAADTGDHFQRRLREEFKDHPLVGEVRGMGLIGAVELVFDKKSKEPFTPQSRVAQRLYGHLLAEGLISRPILNCLAFSPPLIVTKADVDEIVERFGRALGKFTDALMKDGEWRPSA